MARVELPFAFSYSSGTVYVSTTSGGSPTTQAPNGVLEPVVGASVSVTNRDTLNPATIFQGETGASTYSSIVTDVGGNVPGWVDPGSYKIQVAAQGAFAGATINFEAVRGDAVTNLANGSVGALQLQTGSVGLANLVAAVQQALVPTGATFDYAGASAPAGYALCTGAGHQPSDGDWATWSNLFSVISTTYGSFGTGGFRLPNPQGKFILANGSGIGGYQGLGVTGGSLGHVHGLGTPSVVIALGTPSVSVTVPSVLVPNHNHGLSGNGGAQLRAFAGSSGNLFVAASGGGPGFSTTGWSSVTGSSSANVGSNTAKGVQSSYPLIGQTDGYFTNIFTNNGANYGAGGNVNGGQNASGNVNGGQNTAAADPAFFVFNKIIKL